MQFPGISRFLLPWTEGRSGPAKSSGWEGRRFRPSSPFRCFSCLPALCAPAPPLCACSAREGHPAERARRPRSARSSGGWTDPFAHLWTSATTFWPRRPEAPLAPLQGAALSLLEQTRDRGVRHRHPGTQGRGMHSGVHIGDTSSFWQESPRSGLKWAINSL